ncbi:MAG TPA: sulfite oxidase-like oxidoreductase [Candidatus Limnocylindria bacterium]|nr:sulfite oxidase-like oxidoreductase [Candidatus Limnocylindria bacterium]
MTFPWQKRVPEELKDRIPPGQVLTDKFPVLHFGRVPEYPDLARWDFRVWGEVETPFTLTWGEFRQLPTTTRTQDVHCVTRWSKLDTTWVGVAVSEVLDRAGVKSSGSHVMAYSDGGYTTNIPLEALRDDDVLLAHTYDGKPLEHDHGAPLRLLVPKRYFWKSAKFLRRLEVMNADRMGFWELNGYHNDADPWREERHWF